MLNNKTAKNCNNIFLIFVSISLIIPLLMFYMPIFSYGQTIDSGEPSGEQIPTQECPAGQVFNEETLTCEPSGEQIPTQECPAGQVFNEETLTCEPAAEVGEQEQVPAEDTTGTTADQKQPTATTDLEDLITIPETTADQKQPTVTDLEKLTATDQSPPTATGTTSTGAGATPKATKPLYQSQQFNCDPKSATLQVPAKGNKVIELQTYLTDLGYGDLLDPEKIDGKFGPHTKNSVMAYQKDFGLSVDGKVGPQTWGSLCEQISLLPTTFPKSSVTTTSTPTSEDGQANTATPTGVVLQYYCSPSSSTLKIEAKGSAVTNLQKILIDLGYDVGSNGADGDFGGDTQKAVIKFQQDKGLEKVDGEVGPETWEALCAAVSPASPTTPAVSPTTPASEVDCDPSNAEIVHPSKVYQNGMWSFTYGVFKGQGLTIKPLFANSNLLLDSLSVPHFKIDYGGGKSKIVRFCNDENTFPPEIFSEVNQAKKKYDRLEWGFKKVINEQDLKGVLRILYTIIIRTDPVTNCEFSTVECYRFIPMITFSWSGWARVGQDPIGPLPEKFDKFTVFYKLDYGENSGLVKYRDYNFNVPNLFASGPRNFVPNEINLRAVTNGQEGETDNFHNAHLGQQVMLPGCRSTAGDCLHIHLRWGDMTPTIDPLVDTVTDMPVDDSKEGEPYLVPGQTIDVTIARYHPQEGFSTDPTTLVNGEMVGSTKREYYPDPATGLPAMGESRTLASSQHPVVWYMASVSDSNENEFFRHGMFVLDRTK